LKHVKDVFSLGPVVKNKKKTLNASLTLQLSLPHCFVVLCCAVLWLCFTVSGVSVHWRVILPSSSSTCGRHWLSLASWGSFTWIPNTLAFTFRLLLSQCTLVASWWKDFIFWGLCRQTSAVGSLPHDPKLVSWSLTSLFSTNMAISETKWPQVIPIQWSYLNVAKYHVCQS